MPVPTITTDDTLKQASLGNAFSWQLAASESPTNWAASSLPSGLSINSSGLISGTPTESGMFTPSITAENGTGTSTAYVPYLYVVSTAAGQISDAFVTELDFDIQTGKVRIPNVTGWQPASRPPNAAEDTEADEPILVLKPGDKRDLAIGALKYDVLQALSIDKCYLRLYSPRLTQQGYEISDGSAFSTVGSGTTTRYQATLNLPTATYEAITADRGADGRAFEDMLCEIELEATNPAADFSATDTENITALTESDTENDTLTVTLTDQVAQALYDVTFELLCTSDSGIAISFTRRIRVSYDSGGSTFVLDEILSSGDVSSKVADNAVSGGLWTPTLENTSLTATASGLSFDTSVTTTDQKMIILAQEEGSNDGTNVSYPGTPDSWAIKDSSGTELGTLSLSDGDSEADVAAAFLTAVGEIVTVNFDAANDEIDIYLPVGTEVAESEHTSTATASIQASDTAPSKNDASVKVTVAGVSEPQNNTKLTSQSFLVRVEGDLETS